MMIYSSGIDQIEVERFRRGRERFGDRYFYKFFTPDERVEMAGAPAVVAIRSAAKFAAKEAVIKTLGAFFDSGVYWRDVEILERPAGRPSVRLPLRLQRRLEGKRIMVSISQGRQYASAVAIIADEEIMTNEDILQIFRDSGAMLSGHFKLTSGRHSDVYFEKFTILRQPPYVEKLCRLMAEKFATDRIELVVGPTTGGVLIAYEVAKHLGTDSIYAEAGEDGNSRVFKRGFSIDPGTPVLIVDDIMTTGRSVREVIDLCRGYKAEIVGLGLLLDRSGGTRVFDYPLKALATVSADSWDPSECPLCTKNMPITQRGSRKF